MGVCVWGGGVSGRYEVHSRKVHRMNYNNTIVVRVQEREREAGRERESGYMIRCTSTCEREEEEKERKAGRERWWGGGESMTKNTVSYVP